jgi:MFS family permease
MGADAVPVTGVRARIGLFVILSSISFNVLLVIALMPVLSTIAAYYGGGTHGALIAQLLETMSGIGIMVGGPLAGWAADRIGRSNLLFGALALYGVAGSAGLLIDDAYVLLALRLIQGFGSAGIAVSTYSLVSDRFHGAARARVIGYQQAFVSGMGIASLPVAGAIADAHGWHAPFALYLGAFVMLGLAVATVPRSAAPPRQAGPRGGSLAALVPLYLLLIPLYIVATTVNLHISFVLAGDGIKLPSDQSHVMLASSIVYMVGGLLYGRVVVPLGPRRMLCLILAIMAVSWLAIGLSHSAAMTTVGVGLSGLGGGFLIPFATNLVVNRAAPEARGRALGFFYMATYIGNFLNPLIITPIRAALGNHETFLALGVVLVAAAVAQGVFRKSIVNDQA